MRLVSWCGCGWTSVCKRRTSVYECLRELYVRSRVLGRLSESGFAGFFGFSGCGLFPGADVVGRAFVSVVRAFTSVYESCMYVHECWADCLNQDLLDFLDFRDAALVSWCGCGWTSVCKRRTSVVRAFTSVYESCMYVHECWAYCLNQDLLDFLDFRDAACFLVRTWLDERSREMYVRLREFAGCLDCSSCDLCDGL